MSKTCKHGVWDDEECADSSCAAATRSPKIIQILIAPNDSTWQGILLGLGDDGITYKVGLGTDWEPMIDNIKYRENVKDQERPALADVLRIVSEHPEYPEPCPMLHEVADRAAAEMDKEWVMHMIRETCRQTKEAIFEDLKQSLPNAECKLIAAEWI
tara:strand:- start:583 stop:1053 length:471 start_codon:yes stop_codon:yes gene_type:complete